MPDTQTNGDLLEVKDLKTWFPVKAGVIPRTVGHVRAVDGVSLSVSRGESVGLVGESGCGKTTLARTVLGLDPLHAGTVRFEGQDILSLTGGELRAARRNLQIIFQDPFSSLNPRMTVIDIVTEGLLEHGMIHPKEQENAARELLEDVGMDDDALHRYPHEFSGGQRQRISIARAIAFKPRLVICDEAVSALDVSVQAQIINLLIELREKHELSYLFISHDLGVVRHLCDRTAVMYLGRIVESGTSEQIISDPRHPYTRALVSAIPRAGAEKTERIALSGEVPSPSNPPPGCRFHTRCAHVTDACKQTEPTLETIDDGTRQAACIRIGEIQAN
jgi:oligopeptide/dipeptide ABC transporter ATP-binding protein